MIAIDPYVRYADRCSRNLLYPELVVAYDFRIFYMLNGHCTAEFADRRIELAKGSLLLIPPATPYRLLFGTAIAEYYNVNFDLDSAHAGVTPQTPDPVRTFDPSRVVSSYLVAEFSQILLIEDAHAVEEPLRKITEEKYMRVPRGPFSNELATAYLKEALVKALRLQNRRRMPQLVWKIEDYISDHYSEAITNSSIARHFKYHSYYLNRVFLAATGQTIHHTIIACRLKAASRLLVSTNDSIQAIAQACGFETASYFAKAFRSVYALTPLAYRKQNKNY